MKTPTIIITINPGECIWCGDEDTDMFDDDLPGFCSCNCIEEFSSRAVQDASAQWTATKL